MPIEWSRVTFTEHMTEAAAVVGECQVVLDFAPVVRVEYQVKVYEAVRGGAGARFFAIGTDAADPGGFRPLGDGTTPEAAVEACLAAAGVHHRRHVKQAGG